MKFIQKVFILLLSSMVMLTNLGFACTRVLNADNGHAVLVGRTMDWYQDMKTHLVVYPRGLNREGMTANNPLKWSSRYGSIVATVFDAMATDGINERGLAAHILWLDEADYGDRKNNKPAMSLALWAQFYLDNFQSVAEAVSFTEKKSFQLEPLFYPQTNDPITVHLALEDSSGDSAIIEYIHGEVKIYHGRHFLVLTNSPTLDQQLKNLEQYKGFGGDKALPGSTDSTDRFVRATFYSTHLPKANSIDDAIMYTESVIDNISEPYGNPSEERLDIQPTIWRTIANLSDKTYYFKLSAKLNFIWASLYDFNLSSGSPIMKLDVNQINLAGNVAMYFKPINTN